MPTKPLERLMFAQGGLCYFCNDPLPKAEASVEHLVPIARAGSNSDDNCVACCKAINGLLGSMSLKEKIKVVLNQKGQFKCPNGQGQESKTCPPGASPPAIPAPATIGKAPVVPPKPKPAPATKKAASTPPTPETVSAVLKTLKGLGHAKPRRVRTLTSTMKSFHKIKLNDHQIVALIDHLRASGKIIVTGEQITYKL